MSVWETTRSWVTQNARQLVYVRIPPERTDVAPGGPIAPYKGYLRVFLAGMFLTRSRAWFTDRHPCVAAQIRLDLEGQAGAVFSTVVRPHEGMLGPGVRVNYPLTDLLPYSGNLVEIDAALLAIKGERHLDTALGLLQGLSTVLPGPVGAAAGITDMVARSVTRIVDEGDGTIHLGLHDTFGSHGGASPLRSGYLAVVLASPSEIPPASLGVSGHQLYTQTPQGAWTPVQSCDHLLLYVESRAERDNWRLPAIQSAMDRAIEAALLEPGPRADAFKKAAIVAALTSKELTPEDRRRVAHAVKQELDTLSGAAMFSEGEHDLDDAVRKLDLDGGVPSEAALLS